MKRHGFIAVFLSLILILVPGIVFASSVSDDDSADSTLISAYAYSVSGSSNDYGDYMSDYGHGSAETVPGNYVFSFVSGQRLYDAGYDSYMLKNAVITQSDGTTGLYNLSSADIRNPATFMFLIDQSDTMGQNHIEDTVDLITGITESYTGLEQIILFRGSESGSFDISDPTNADEVTDAFSNMVWTDSTDFYQSIDESLEALSSTMNTESSTGWAPGSVANLILITDRSLWELQSASTQIADYPEIIVHTVSIRDEDYNRDPALLKGCTGKQIITGTMKSEGSSGITISPSTMSAVEIVKFVDNLIPYRVSLRSPLSSFSIQLVSASNGGGATSVLKNVKMLNESDGHSPSQAGAGAPGTPGAEGDPGADNTSETAAGSFGAPGADNISDTDAGTEGDSGAGNTSKTAAGAEGDPGAGNTSETAAGALGAPSADNVSSADQPDSSAGNTAHTNPVEDILSGLGAAQKGETAADAAITAGTNTVPADTDGNSGEDSLNSKLGGISIPLIGGLCLAAVAMIALLALLFGRRKPESSRDDQDNDHRGGRQREADDRGGTQPRDYQDNAYRGGNQRKADDREEKKRDADDRGGRQRDADYRGTGLRESAIEKPRTEPLTSGAQQSTSTARPDSSRSAATVSMSGTRPDSSKTAATVSMSGTRPDSSKAAATVSMSGTQPDSSKAAATVSMSGTQPDSSKAAATVSVSNAHPGTQDTSKTGMPSRKSFDPETVVSPRAFAASNADRAHPARKEEQDGSPTQTPAMIPDVESINTSENRDSEPNSTVPAAPHISVQIEEIEGNYTGTATVFTLDRELLIGSDPGQCELVFTQEGIASRHARIFRRNDLVFIEDLNSGTGTFLDGMRLFSSNRLRSGDEIGIGDAGFTVRFL